MTGCWEEQTAGRFLILLSLFGVCGLFLDQRSDGLANFRFNRLCIQFILFITCCKSNKYKFQLSKRIQLVEMWVSLLHCCSFTWVRATASRYNIFSGPGNRQYYLYVPSLLLLLRCWSFPTSSISISLPSADPEGHGCLFSCKIPPTTNVCCGTSTASTRRYLPFRKIYKGCKYEFEPDIN